MPTKPVLTKIPNLIGWIYDFDFQPKCNAVQHRSFGVNPTLDTDINSMLIFKPKFNVCPMLEADVNQTLGFRIDQIFISYHKPVSVQCWMLGSTKKTLNWPWVPAGPWPHHPWPLLPPLTPHTSAYPLQTTYHLQNYTYLSELLHRHNPTHALRCAKLHWQF